MGRAFALQRGTTAGRAFKMYRTPGFVQMHILPLSEFRANASAMLDLVERGETVRILRHGKPVAELVPIQPDAAERQPSWKRAVTPLKVDRPDGRTLAQLIIAERDQARRTP